MQHPVSGITVYLQGGLGNQLFGLAVGLENAIRLECSLSLVFTDTRDRTLELGRFPLPDYVTLRETPRLRDLVQARYPNVARNFLTLQVIAERSFAYDERLIGIDLGSKLVGYFQSWRYLEKSVSLIRAGLETLSVPTDNTSQVADFISSGPTLCVHVRRGDYLALTDVHSPLADDYFEAALRAIPLQRMAIFTDDNEYKMPSWGQGFETIIVRPDSGISALATMALMSRCDAFIISNSTFSWWPAWAASLERRAPVICPDPWFTGGVIPDIDLIPPSWVRLNQGVGLSTGAVQT